MTINTNLDTWGGLPTEEYDPAKGLPADASGTAWVLRTETYEGDIKAIFDSFFAQTSLDTVEVVVVGGWEEMYDNDASFVYERFVREAARLPSLRAFFCTDVTFEENEISWINQADATPMLRAFPQLQELGLRGGNQLVLGPVEHADLRKLVIETGGLPGSVLRSVGASSFPALRHLELWLGTDEYGGTTRVEDVDGILAGTAFPRLEYLGLRNAELADAVAARLGTSPLAQRVKSIDLSLGVLSDAGGEELLKLDLAHLDKLDLHRHYLTEAMQQRLKSRWKGVEVDVSLGEDPEEEYRYVETGE